MVCEVWVQLLALAAEERRDGDVYGGPPHTQARPHRHLTLLRQRRQYHETLLQLPFLIFLELGRHPQLPFPSRCGGEVPHHSVLRLNKMAAVWPAGPCSSSGGQPSFPQQRLALSWLQGKGLFTTIYYIFCREIRNLTGKAWTRAPSIPLGHSNMAGTHFHPHFSFSNPCGGAVSWPHEAAE